LSIKCCGLNLLAGDILFCGHLASSVVETQRAGNGSKVDDLSILEGIGFVFKFNSSGLGVKEEAYLDFKTFETHKGSPQ
jgi:hypothetical protein